MNLLKHMSNWIIKSKIQLDEILPVIDQFTDQDNAIDLSTNLRSTKGKNSRQWQLFNKDSDEWLYNKTKECFFPDDVKRLRKAMQ